VIDGFVDFFGLKMGLELPDVKTTHGTQASRKFRIAGIPFKPYDLRHHFNFYGTTIKGHSSSTMAILLGHTVITNQRIYQRGLDGTWALKAFDAKE
jgi:integrase